MKRFATLFRLACLGLAALACRGELPPEQQTWYEGRSAHFAFITDGNEAAARERALTLETLHAVLRTLSPDLQRRKAALRPQPPSSVYLFATEKGFKAYSEQAGIEGFFVRHLDGTYIAMDSGAPGASETANHEYLHQFLEAQFPGVPLWLDEGLACFYMTMKVRGKELSLGQAPDGFLPYLFEQGAMPVSRLLALNHESAEYRDPAHHPGLYPSFWLFTDFFMTGGEAQIAQLGTFLDLIRSGLPPEVCRQRAFGRSPAELDKELKAHLALIKGRRAVRGWSVHFQTFAPDTSFSFRPLPRSEALARLGLLLCSGHPGQKAAALEHFEAALALDPDSVPANEGRGLLALLDDHPGAAEPYFARASRGDPDNGLLHFYAGYSAYRELALGGGQDLGPARVHLQRAVDLHYPDPAALGMLTEVILQGEHLSPEDFALLEAAFASVPDPYRLKVDVAAAHLRAHQREQARALLEEAAAQTLEAGAAIRARGWLQTMDRQAAEDLHRAAMEAFKAEAYEEAVKDLKEAIRLMPEAWMKQQYEDNLKDMAVLIDLRAKAAAKKHK